MTPPRVAAQTDSRTSRSITNSPLGRVRAPAGVEPGERRQLAARRVRADFELDVVPGRVDRRRTDRRRRPRRGRRRSGSRRHRRAGRDVVERLPAGADRAGARSPSRGRRAACPARARRAARDPSGSCRRRPGSASSDPLERGRTCRRRTRARERPVRTDPGTPVVPVRRRSAAASDRGVSAARGSRARVGRREGEPQQRSRDRSPGRSGSGS